jgi:glycosyltransferase involved in cell wall biosynthesis
MTSDLNKRRAGAAPMRSLSWVAEGDTSPAPVSARAPTRISCIVCAYNEADRIQHILNAVYGHPALDEVIVVNDGSTDATAALLAGYPDIRVISYAPNRGKTYALSRGIVAARGEHLMLLDADLTGVTAADIQALADPVIGGWAQVSISLRRNSLAIYRALGLDFVSGERVIPAGLMSQAVAAMQRLPRWGGEAFINELITRQRLSIAVVDWPSVFNVRKYKKVGRWRGLMAEFTMMGDALRVLSPWGVVRQNLALLRLVRRGRTPRLEGYVAHQIPEEKLADQPVNHQQGQRDAEQRHRYVVDISR